MKMLLLAIVLVGTAPPIAGAQTTNAATSNGETVPPKDSSPVPTVTELNRTIQELTEDVAQLKTQQEAEELAELRRSATAEAAVAGMPQAGSAETVFSSANRALQALNPEISAVIDAGGRVIVNDFQPDTVGDESGFYYRVLGLHLETNLDPFSFLKAAVEIHPGGAELGEAYATWTEVLPNTSLTLGKFRQQFGVVNRWHVPSLDQYDFPLALTTILGPEGLNQIGFSLDWSPSPIWADSQTLTLQVTNGTNEQLFAGEYFSIPSVLAHLLSYYDLTENTYLELGLSGMLGWNNQRHVAQEIRQTAYDSGGQPVVLYDDQGNPVETMTVVTGSETLNEPWRQTWLGGVDLTLSWVPLSRERFSGVTWRTEYFLVDKEIPDDRIRAMGAYSYLDWRLSEAWVVGARADVTQPFAVDNEDQLIYQGVAYLTWWQSPWVKTRLQYAHQWGTDLPHRDQLFVQFVFAAGPHKHERY